MLDKIILGILTMKDMTSYDLKKALDGSINHFYSTSYGSIHPALVKLEKNSLISCRKFKEGGRNKKLYTILNKGKEVFQEWLQGDILMTRMKEAALVKVFFFGMLEKDRRENVISTYIDEIDTWIDRLKEMKNSIGLKDIKEEHRDIARFQVETLQFGIDQAEFEDVWFRDFLKNRI